jgi:hypothetical protein
MSPLSPEQLLEQAKRLAAEAQADPANQGRTPQQQVEHAGRVDQARRLAGGESAESIAGEVVVPPTRRDMQQEELQGLPIGETIARKAQLLGKGAVQGVGDILSLPAMVVDQQFRPPGEGSEFAPKHPSPRPPQLAPHIQRAAGAAADFASGGVTPQSTGEHFTELLGEEGAAGGPIAWGLRKLAQAKTAAGSVNRYWMSLSDESARQFALQEGLGAFGSASGRLITEQGGPGSEMLGAIGGDLTLRNVPGLARRTVVRSAGFLNMKFRSIDKQERLLQKQIIDEMRKPGGIEAFAATPKGLRLLNEAAEYMQRQMGREFDVDAAMRLIDDMEQYAADFGMNLDDIALPSILDNPGLKTLVTQATARNPNLAVHLQAATERGSSAVRRKMAEIGPPQAGQADFDSQLTNATAVVRSEADRRISAVARQVDEAKAARAGGVAAVDQAAIDELGDFGKAGSDAAQKLKAAENFGESVIDDWKTTKIELINPAYEHVELLAEQHKNLKWSNKHSKAALGEVKGKLREAGETGAPHDLMEIIHHWDESGTDFARLRDMQEELGERIIALKADSKFRQADRLQKLKNGIDKDILDYELLEVEIPDALAGKAAPGAGAGSSESNTINLQRDRSAEARRSALEGSRERGEEILGLNERVGIDAQIDRTGKATGTGLEGPFEGPSLRELSDAGGNAAARTLDDVRTEERSLREFMSTAEDPAAAARVRVRLNALQTEREAIVARMRQPEGPATKGRPAKGKRGTGGQGGISDDTAKGLANERSRKIVQEALDVANTRYQKFAAEYYDSIATGQIIEAHRIKSPIPHGDTLGLYLEPGGLNKPGSYTQRVDEFLVRAGDSPETIQRGQDWLVADAYQRNVELVQQADGSYKPRLNRVNFDKWKRRNAYALDKFEGAQRMVDDAETLMVEARKLGAAPLPTPLAIDRVALETFIGDPQKFWDDIPAMGIDEGRKRVNDVMKTIVDSGDERALFGLKESFMTSHLVRQFTVEFAGEVTPKTMKSAIDTIIDTPALYETVQKLFGDEHARLLRVASKQTDAIAATGQIPANVQSLKLRTPTEQFQETATKGSLWNVIMGPVRRTSKLASAAEKFNRDLTLIQRNAIYQEAVRNPPLLRDLLTRDYTAETIRGIRTRMGANYPTLFPRVERNQERLEDERQDEEQEEEANRAVVTPPRTSLLSPPVAALGRFG